MHSTIAISYVLLLCAFLPLLAWISKRKLDEGIAVPRMALYAEALVLQTVLLGISYGVAHLAGIPIFRMPPLDASDCVTGAAILALALGTVAIAWRVTRGRSAGRLRLFVPQQRNERLAWVVVSMAAGLSEEVAFRGVLPILLHGMTGTLWIAIVVSAAAFAMAHVVQGWWAALFVGLFGLVFHGVVWLTGGLWIAIVVHVLYDVIVGFTAGKLLARSPEATDAPM